MKAPVRIFSLPSPGGGGSAAKRPGWGGGLSPAVVFQWFNASFERTMHLDINSLKHGSQIARDLGIPEANDTIALLLEPHLPFVISLGSLVVVVMTPIEFKDEAFRRTEEIDNVRTDRCLAPEMRALDRDLFQSTPQCAFMRRRVGAQSLGCSSTDRIGDHESHALRDHPTPPAPRATLPLQGRVRKIVTI